MDLKNLALMTVWQSLPDLIVLLTLSNDTAWMKMHRVLSGKDGLWTSAIVILLPVWPPQEDTEPIAQLGGSPYHASLAHLSM